MPNNNIARSIVVNKRYAVLLVQGSAIFITQEPFDPALDGKEKGSRKCILMFKMKIALYIYMFLPLCLSYTMNLFELLIKE